MLARALVKAFFPLVKNKLNQAVLINDSGTRNIPLLSPQAPIYHPPVKRGNDEPAERAPGTLIDGSFYSHTNPRCVTYSYSLLRH